MRRDCALAVIAIMSCHVILCCDDEALQHCVDEFNNFVLEFDSDSHRTIESLESQCVIMEETVRCARPVLEDCHNTQEARIMEETVRCARPVLEDCHNTQEARIMEETVRCARPVLEDCHNTQEAYVGGQLDAHEYLCHNIDVYHEHQICLRNAELERDIQACTYTEDHYDSATNHEQLCRNAVHDLNCIRDHTISQCGSTEAGNFEYTFHKTRLLRLFELVNCELNEVTSHDPTWALGTTPEFPTTSDADGDGSPDPAHDTRGLSTGAIIGISVGAVLLVVFAIGILTYAILSRNKNSASSSPPPTASLPTTAPDGSTALENPLYSVAQNGVEGPVSQSNGHGLNNNYPVYEELSPDNKLPPSGEHAVVLSDDMSKMSYKPDC